MRDLDDKALGAFLRDRRAKLDPSCVGLPVGRRRTPGLRREEVATRANVSAAWYTFLEQGRAGIPSVAVLDRLAVALMLSSAEREHLFLLAQHRPPQVEPASITTLPVATQRLLDALTLCPAYVRNPAWDLIGWNTAAVAMWGDFSAVPAASRNLLSMFFLDTGVRERNDPQWDEIAAALVASFRSEMTRAGSSAEAAAVATSLGKQSPEFRTLWERLDIEVPGGPMKQVAHSAVGNVMFEVSTLRLEGPGDLRMVVFNPASSADGRCVSEAIALLRSAGKPPALASTSLPPPVPGVAALRGGLAGSASLPHRPGAIPRSEAPAGGASTRMRAHR